MEPIISVGKFVCNCSDGTSPSSECCSISSDVSHTGPFAGRIWHHDGKAAAGFSIVSIIHRITWRSEEIVTRNLQAIIPIVIIEHIVTLYFLCGDFPGIMKWEGGVQLSF